MRAPALAVLLSLPLSPAVAEPLPLDVERIETFAIAGPDEPGGPLEFLGGIRLTSSNRDFGGLSGIEVLEGDVAFMVSDTGRLVRATLVHENGRLVGIAEAEIDSLYPDGNAAKSVSDTEDVAFDPDDPTRGVVVRERQANAMLTFEMSGGNPANFQPKTVGAADRILRSNKGLESVAYAPAASPVAGEIVAIGEAPPPGSRHIPGWVAGVGAFEIVAHDDFEISSARFLPDGDLVLLERRYIPAWGIDARLRRIPGESVEAGSLLDGDYILDAGMTSQIDNFEGLAVHRDEAGRTILTLVSDNNFSLLQRTLILQFALSDD
ncbi:MAG TPA: esterase-like activity of phytase family protein [Propylenella sp.]